MSTQKQPKPPTVKGPGEWFTGDVYFNAYYAGQTPSRTRLNLVRFTPGAHTAWHKHAVGQTLHVTEGLGYVQSRGEELIELHPATPSTPRRGNGTGTGPPPTTSCATWPCGKRRRMRTNPKPCGAPSSPTKSTPTASTPRSSRAPVEQTRVPGTDPSGSVPGTSYWLRPRPAIDGSSRAGLSWVAAQEASIRRASAVGEPSGAVYTFMTSPGSLGSSIDW